MKIKCWFLVLLLLVPSVASAARIYSFQSIDLVSRNYWNRALGGSMSGAAISGGVPYNSTAGWIASEMGGTRVIAASIPGAGTRLVTLEGAASAASGRAIGLRSVAFARAGAGMLGIASAGFMLYSVMGPMLLDANEKSLHPKLYQSFYKPGDVPVNPNGNMQVGDIINTPTYGYKRITSINNTATANTYANQINFYSSSVQINGPANSNGTGSCWLKIFYYTGATAPPDVPRNEAEIDSQIGSYDAAQDPAYMAELENMFAYHGDQVVTADEPNILTSNDAASVAARNAALATSNQEGLQSAVDAAQSAVEAAQAAYAANPSTENLRVLNDAIANLAALRDAANQAAQGANNANQDPATGGDPETEPFVPPVVPDNVYDATLDQPEKKEIKGLVQGMITNSPFSALIRSFVITPTAPESAFAVDVYGSHVVFDIGQFNSTFVALGAVLLAVSHGVSIFMVFKK